MANRPFFAIAAIVLSGIILAACQPQTRAPCPAGKLCLEYGNGADPTTLDPQLAQATNESAILRELFQGLYADGPDGAPVLGAAQETPSVSADGLTWTFHLRPATWSDGQPVTANDFVYAYRRMLSPKTGSAYAYLLFVLKNAREANGGTAPLESIGARALDDRTLELTLEHPASYLPQLLKHQAFFPLPAHVVQQWGAKWVSPAHYVSNGAYVLRDWRLGDYVRIEKNPRFDGVGSVCFDRVDFYPTADPISAEREVLQGQLDVSNGIQPNRVRHLRAKPDSARFVHSHTYLSTYYMAFNRHVPALQDPRVRQAISMAIDRDFIAEKLLAGGQTPAMAFVPPGIAGYVPQGPSRPHPYWAGWSLDLRQEVARRLMVAAGYGLGHPLKLELKTVITQGSPVAGQSIQADLKSIGVNIEFRQEDGIVVYQSYNQRDFQLGFAGWIADFNDPMTFLGLMKSDTGAQNYGDYNNPAYDALLVAADNEPDGGKRAAILAKAEQMIIDDANVAPIYTSVNLNMVSPHITGWVDNDTDIHPIRYLCRNDAPPGLIKPAR
jgi:oligopeptide transport system substrate-binding protein